MQISTDNIKQKYLDVKQVSHILQIDKSKVYSLCHSNKFKTIKSKANGPSRIFISKESVEDYAKEHLHQEQAETLPKPEVIGQEDYYTAKEVADMLNISCHNLIGIIRSGGLEVKNPNEQNLVEYQITKESVQRYQDFLHHKNSTYAESPEKAKTTIGDVFSCKTIELICPQFVSYIEKMQNRSLEDIAISLIAEFLKTEIINQEQANAK